MKDFTLSKPLKIRHVRTIRVTKIVTKCIVTNMRFAALHKNASAKLQIMTLFYLARIVSVTLKQELQTSGLSSKAANVWELTQNHTIKTYSHKLAQAYFNESCNFILCEKKPV